VRIILYSADSEMLGSKYGPETMVRLQRKDAVPRGLGPPGRSILPVCHLGIRYETGHTGHPHVFHLSNLLMDFGSISFR
jgi:hypothetical protein